MGTGGFTQFTRLFACLAVVCSGLSWAGPAIAQTFAPDSCDTQYMESLEARAWLEAQREIVQNQNLIVKPDSVLEYTCFDKHLDVLVQASSNLLSGNTQYGGSSAALTGSLSSVVNGAFGTYLTSNFNHRYLGGRSTLDYNNDGTVSSGGYTCNEMDKAWMFAKCMDFLQQPGHDGFFTFQEYEGTDYRTLPAACGSNGPFQTNFNRALVTTPWARDNVNTYLQCVYPPSGGPAGSPPVNQCGGACSMVPTGATVFTSQYTGIDGYQEQACLVSGCKYVPRITPTSTINGKVIATTGCCTTGTSCPP